LKAVSEKAGVPLGHLIEPAETGRKGVLRDDFLRDVLDSLLFLRPKGGIFRLKRTEKEKQVAWLREQFQGVRGLFLADFQGLTVSETNELRAALRSRGMSFKVLKNTLVRLAYRDTDVAVLEKDVAGPRAAAWTTADDQVPAMAKVLIDFAKAHPKMKIVRGVLNGKLVDPVDVDTLSKLPSKEEMLARLLGTMMAPVSAFVNTLAAVPRSFLNVLKAIEEKKGGRPQPESSAG
jgi:large subunit ribosomal protein L10